MSYEVRSTYKCLKGYYVVVCVCVCKWVLADRVTTSPEWLWRLNSESPPPIFCVEQWCRSNGGANCEAAHPSTSPFSPSLVHLLSLSLTLGHPLKPFPSIHPSIPSLLPSSPILSFSHISLSSSLIAGNCHVIIYSQLTVSFESFPLINVLTLRCTSVVIRYWNIFPM